MMRLLKLLAGVVIAGATQLSAQAPASTPHTAGSIHIVTYLEIDPGSQATVANLLRRYRDATRKEPGNLRAVALQRGEPRNHFALIETWSDQAAIDAHKKASHTVELRDVLDTRRLAPADERILKDAEATPILEKSAPKGAIYVLTHADALPPASRGTDLLLPLAGASRRELGNVSFEVLQQPSRLNHCTVVEVWRSDRDRATHAQAPHTKAFREKWQDVTGALYDERTYTSLN
jgi:quinol monooxygenase YgiN